MSGENSERRRQLRFEQVPLESIFAELGKQKKVLNVSSDPCLLETRKAILERGGYQVVCASSAEEAVRLCRHESFKAIVLGHSLPGRLKHAVIQAARKYNPDARIIGLYKVSPNEAAGADIIIDSHDGPDLLLQAVRQNRGKWDGPRL